MFLVLCSGYQPASAVEPHWPASLTIGTASPGGTYHAYGGGLARILTRALNIPVVARATEGPGQNILLLEAGEIQVGFVTLGVALQGWNGSAPWTGGKQLRTMRALFPMYDTPFQFMVREESGIHSVGELSGKRIGVGPQGGTSGAYIPEFFKVLKVDASLVHGEWAELANQVQAGALDGLAVAAGVPFPSFIDLEQKGKVRYLPVTPQQIRDLRLAMPELGTSVVGAGTYPSLRNNYGTVGLYNFAVAHRDVPADLVYAIVDAVFANHDELVEVHSAAAETVPANFTRNSFLPFHDGASRWYQNHGAIGITRGD
ncbi:TAXI family TRAP transporter solute-binding subunit (plasmid) [Microvirga sp. VF16]|nr:TAXI family TRAP transporter solute-binding subunit [Microvirga sp. VF16]